MDSHIGWRLCGAFCCGRVSGNASTCPTLFFRCTRCSVRWSGSCSIADCRKPNRHARRAAVGIAGARLPRQKKCCCWRHSAHSRSHAVRWCCCRRAGFFAGSKAHCVLLDPAIPMLSSVFAGPYSQSRATARYRSSAFRRPWRLMPCCAGGASAASCITACAGRRIASCARIRGWKSITGCCSAARARCCLRRSTPHIRVANSSGGE